MPIKKPINFQQQIENSEQFLKKLQSIKKTSHDLKEKNKLTQHRNLWCKEYKYLARLERDMDIELTNYFDIFDRYFQHQIEERQIFTKQNPYRNYAQLKSTINHNLLAFEAQTFQQVQSLPILIDKVSKTAKKQVKKTQILQILNDISKVLFNINSQNLNLEKQLKMKSHGKQSKQNSTKLITEQSQKQQLQFNQQNESHQQSLQQEQSDGPQLEQNLILEEDEEQQVLLTLQQLAPKKIRGFDMEKQTIIKLKQSESNLMQYLQLFNQKLSEDEIYEVINEFNHANQLLQQTFQLEKQKIALDYQDSLTISPTFLQNSQAFMKISHIYSTYIGRGKSLQLYYERLAIEFPKTSKKQLQTFTAYIEAKIYKQKKLNSLKRNFYRQKQQLFTKVQKQIHHRIQKNIEKQKKRAEELSRKQEKLKLQKQLELLRQDYNKRKQQKQRQQQQIQQRIKQQNRKKQAIRRLYLDELAKKAEQVSVIKTQKQLEEQAQIQLKKQKQEQEKKKNIMQNKPKVQLRQSVERRKLQKKVQERQFRQKLPEMQAQRIKNAIESYNFRPKVQFDKQRLNKPTQAMVKRKQTFMDKADKVQLSKMTGYSVNQLMSDMRFKVNMALQQAGLSHTDYARQLLVSMSKKPN